MTIPVWPTVVTPCVSMTARSWRARTRVAGRDDWWPAVSVSTVGDRFLPLGWGRLLSAGKSGAWRGFIDFAVSTPFGPMQRSRPGSC